LILLKNRSIKLRAMQKRAEADWAFAIAFRRNIDPRALLTGKLPDPIRVVSAIRE
jgi:hypothetical protein